MWDSLCQLSSGFYKHIPRQLLEEKNNQLLFLLHKCEFIRSDDERPPAHAFCPIESPSGLCIVKTVTTTVVMGSDKPLRVRLVPVKAPQHCLGGVSVCPTRKGKG